MISIKKTSITVFVLFLLFTVGASAAYSQDDIKSLKKQLAALQQKVNKLEASQTGKAPALAVQPQTPAITTSKGRAWDPFVEMQNMQTKLDKIFRDTFYNANVSHRGLLSNRMFFSNQYSLEETKNGYKVKFDIGGLNDNKIDVNVNPYSITVKGEKSQKEQTNGINNGSEYQSYEVFTQTIPIPKDADTTKVKMDRKGNELIIFLPEKT